MDGTIQYSNYGIDRASVTPTSSPSNDATIQGLRGSGQQQHNQ